MKTYMIFLFMGLSTGAGTHYVSEGQLRSKPCRGTGDRRMSRKCKMCGINETALVFVPCGHVTCCEVCGIGQKKCNVCHGRIRGSLPYP